MTPLIGLDSVGLGDLFSALQAIHGVLGQVHDALDVGRHVREGLNQGLDDMRTHLENNFITATTNRGGGGQFVLDETVQHVLPHTTRIANAGLTLACVYASARLMWSHGLFTKYTLRTMLPRLLLAVFLVNFAAPLFQAAVDMNNALFHDALQATISNLRIGDELKSWADDAWGAPGLGAVTAVLLILGFLLLGVAYVVRYALLVVLVVLAPIAALMTILEETHKYAKEWASMTVSTLLMQPLQLFILGIGVHFEAGGGTNLPVRHGFALASLWMAYKVPGALRSASLAGSHAMSLGRRGAAHHVLRKAGAHHAVGHAAAIL